jgi:hypothetical protein
MPQMSACINRGAESREILGLERLENPGIDVHFLGGLQNRQALFLARGPQPRPDTGT